MVSDPITIDSSLNVQDAQEIMRSWGVRHLPVVENGQLVGVLSDRDIYRAISIKKTHDLSVREAMSKKPFVVSSTQTLSYVAKSMAKHKYGCVVVKGSNGSVRGIFTTTDALFILSQLLEYPDDEKFRVMSMDEYLASYQQLSA